MKKVIGDVIAFLDMARQIKNLERCSSIAPLGTNTPLLALQAGPEPSLGTLKRLGWSKLVYTVKRDDSAMCRMCRGDDQLVKGPHPLDNTAAYVVPPIQLAGQSVGLYRSRSSACSCMHRGTAKL